MGEKEAAPETAGAPPRGGCFCMGIGPELSEMLRRVGPSESVRQHFRNARIEVLKGIRALIDERIEGLSRSQEKGTKVAVE